MNINKMIDMLLIKLSYNKSVFYLEKRNYKEGKTYKSYLIKIGNNTKEFKSKKDLLLYLSNHKEVT